MKQYNIEVECTNLGQRKVHQIISKLEDLNIKVLRIYEER